MGKRPVFIIRVIRVTARISVDCCPNVHDNSEMRIAYESMGGTGPIYEIEADRYGSYTIWHAGTVVKRVTSVTSYPGKPRWGSKKLALGAIVDAKAAIDAHHSTQA